MPPEIESQFREKSLSQLLWAIQSTERKKSLGALGLNIILKVLRGALQQLHRLATLAGLTLVAYMSTGLSAQADEPVRMQSSIALDFDKDGDLDLIDFDADSDTGKIQIDVLRNNGFHFKRQQVHATDFPLDLVANADIDGDGDEDLVLVELYDDGGPFFEDGAGIAWLENKGSEVFVPHDGTSWNLQGPINEAFVADMNQDGRPDVVYATPGAVGWVKSQGSDGFVPQTAFVSGLSEVSALEVADVDGDGDNDIYYADSSPSGIGWIKNNGSENFVPQAVGTQVPSIDALELTDLDQDGHKDLLYASKSLSTVGWMANNGSDNFLPAEALSGGLNSVDQVQVADVNQDGRPDVVYKTPTAIGWMKNQGSENFIPQTIVDTSPAPFVAEEPVPMKPSIPMDFDEDGDLDLIDADSQTGKVTLIRNNGLVFKGKDVHQTNFSADLVGNADMDRDGDQDLVVLDKDAGGIAWLENKGSEVFVPHNIANLQGPVNEAYVADMNQDGRPDIVYAAPGAVGWIKNQGSDSFVPQTPLDSGLADVSALEVADADGDGDNDIYYTDSTIGGIGFIKNQGSENFVPQVVGSQVLSIDDLEFSDLDGDGRKDLIYASKSMSAVGWMANNGSENFMPAEVLGGGLTAVDQIQVADLDQDGDEDLVAASSESDLAAWLENNGSEQFTPHDLG